MPSGSRRVTPVIATVFVALMLSACSGGSATDGRILVSAASSLGEAFAEMETAFETIHPDIDVVLNLAGSSLLKTQVIAGASVDVFASASMEIMEEVVRAGLVEGSPVVFVSNEIQIAVPVGNPAGLDGIADFGRTDLYLGLCAASVPCGELARQSLDMAGVVPTPSTNEPNVKSLLTKIETGELDGGIVYRTDVLAGEVEGIEIPEQFVTSTGYPLGLIVNPSGSLGDEFFDFVLSAEGQAILGKYGFGKP